MTDRLTAAIDILDRLVGIPSLSGRPNREIVSYIQDYLAGYGVAAALSHDEAGERANIFATIGPDVEGGVVLNGHTDVVPVEGQNWASDPFTLTRRGARLFGRGSVDMKGFLAAVLASVPAFRAADLKAPIHIAFSYDEEIGGLGMPVLLDSMAGMMAGGGVRPGAVIVGEPTGGAIVTGHKGGFEMRAEITGLEAHSCDPSRGVSAIGAATRLIARIEEIGRRRAANPAPGSPFDPPFATVNIGVIEGGSARNAVPGWCNFDWEYRPMPGEDGALTIAEVEAYAADVLTPEMRALHPDAGVRIITEAALPALDDRNAARAAAFVSEITGVNSRSVVSFGTDAGYFSDAGFSTVVFGFGDIGRAHAADEYVETGEISATLDFLGGVAAKLSL